MADHWNPVLQGLHTGPVGRHICKNTRLLPMPLPQMGLLGAFGQQKIFFDVSVVPEEPWCCSSSFIEVQLWSRLIPVPSDRKPKPHVHVAVPLAARESQQPKRCVHTGSSLSCSSLGSAQPLLLYTAPLLCFCTVCNP